MKKIGLITSILFLIVYVYLVIRITLFNRSITEYATYNMELFWCVKKAWNEKSSLHWYYVIGNILLFMPMGFLIPFFIRIMRKIEITILVGLVISMMIELIQFTFHIGLFEFDDIINNAIGNIMGYGVFIIIYCYHNKYKYRKIDCLIEIIVWGYMTLFIATAIINGQPVFSELINRTISLLNCNKL